jgi:hypothetical protein
MKTLNTKTPTAGGNPAEKVKRNEMKRKIFVINETKGFFTENEENLCKEYCRVNCYTYRAEYINVGY